MMSIKNTLVKFVHPCYKSLKTSDYLKVFFSDIDNLGTEN